MRLFRRDKENLFEKLAREDDEKRALEQRKKAAALRESNRRIERRVEVDVPDAFTFPPGDANVTSCAGTAPSRELIFDD